jgi:hypothetical protein
MNDKELLNLEDKKYLAHKADRKANTEILTKKLDELKPTGKVEITNKPSEIAAAFWEMLRGDKGEKGDQGEQGVQGDQGIQGEQGIQGLNGKDGKKGEKGNDGKDGLDGKDGIDGVDGKQGKKGKDGSPDTSEQIIEKLSTVQKAWLKVSQIIGINDLLTETGNNFLQQAKAFVPRVLASLFDVNIPNPLNGQALTYNSTTKKWEATTASGSGTVTTVSVASANGFAGTVANPSTTPAITVSTSVTGLLKGNGTAVSAASSGTDYAPATSGSSVLKGNGAGGFTNSKVALTEPSTAATLTIADNKTLTANNSLTLAGTDSTTMTFPTTSATIARTDAANTFTGVQTTTQVLSTNNAITASGNAATVPITSKINTVTNNSAATLTITMATSGAIDRQLVIVCILDSSAAAQTITWVNTENSTVTAPTTSNGSTTLPLTVGFQYNNATSKWRCIASA